MPTYFGETNITTPATDAPGGATIGNVNQVFTCPGSGNQILKELSAYVRYNTGKPQIRMAIYNSAGSTLIAQGTAAVAFVNGAFEWAGHLTQSSITPNPAILIGGTNYMICVCQDGTIGTQTGSANDQQYTASNYTSGFPASITLGSNLGSHYIMRAGVDPEVVAGGAFPGSSFTFLRRGDL